MADQEQKGSVRDNEPVELGRLNGNLGFRLRRVHQQLSRRFAEQTRSFGFRSGGISALAIRDQVLPPTINHDQPSPGCDLDFVPNAPRKTALEYGLTNSFGFGGTNGALILRRYTG